MAQRRKRSAVSWSACKAAIRDWPRPGLVALIKELYELSDENRRFLHARLLPDQSEQTLDAVKRKLKGMLSVSTVFNGRFKHGDVKRIVDQYEKGSDDPAPVGDLLVTDLEIGFATFNEVGDFEPMVDHLYSTIYRLDKVLAKVPEGQLRSLVSRLGDLAERWGMAFGYGISDELSAFAKTWEERLAGAEGERPIEEE